MKVGEGIKTARRLGRKQFLFFSRLCARISRPAASPLVRPTRQNRHATLACEQALCLGRKIVGKGGERACRQTFEAAIPPSYATPKVTKYQRCNFIIQIHQITTKDR